jgi:uroporphyrinogen decarboxylase
MTKREVVKQGLDHKRPPYVPWSYGFTKEAKVKLIDHYGDADLETYLDNHLLKLGSDIRHNRVTGRHKGFRGWC